MPDFATRIVDLADWLKSRTLMGEFRGDEVCARLQSEVEQLGPCETLIVDTTRALFLDYDFSCYAFRRLFVDPTPARAHHVIYQVAHSDQNAFFHGVLKARELPRGAYAESRATFVAQGLVCKLITAPSGPIDFIAALSSPEGVLLSAVNVQGRADIQHLARAVGRSIEEVSEPLRELIHKGFVIDVSEDRHEYYSFNSYLKS